ncbi:MAG: hypothetical protein IGS03_10145 [Candidatus Sericytochromatia bacterium]|nr:hypothetical protein [Candidatus Sericytochromatia bacterium]
MKIYNLRRFTMALICLMVISACESAPLEAPGPDKGRGNVKDFIIEPNIRVALINEIELEQNKNPEINYGAMDAHFVTIDDITYMIEWNDLEDFKNLKQGEEVTFRAAGYIARVEKTGKTYRVIRLHEL